MRGVGWLTSSHYRPPLVVATICFSIQSWSLLDNDIGVWPTEVRTFWSLATLATAAVCAVAACRVSRPSRYLAACAIVAVELGRATVIFAEYGSTVSHIIARHCLIGFLAAYLLLDD